VIQLFIRHPLVGGIFGWTLAAVCIWLLFAQVIPEYRSFPDQPVPMTAEDAVRQVESGQEVWVVLTDVRWSCLAALPRADAVLLTLPNGRRIVADLGGGRCQTMADPATGVLSMTSAGRRSYIRSHSGFEPTPLDEPLLTLCPYCGRDNALTGLIVAPILALAGLSIYPLLRAARRQHHS